MDRPLYEQEGGARHGSCNLLGGSRVLPRSAHTGRLESEST